MKASELKQKLLFLDLETSPIIGYSWGLFEQNIIKRIKPFTILSFAYKWLGKKVHVEACDNQSEYQLLKKLHKLLSDASVVVAHNGDSFDIRKINARFIIHKIDPPSPYVTIDTKKVASRVAYFDSNSLNNLGIDMGEGEKIKHRGFDMWEGCMAGNKRDWRDMKRYNMQDVVLLEKIYLRLRPWIKNHPNQSVSDDIACPKCASKDLEKRGMAISNGMQYQRYKCRGCGGWCRGKQAKKLVTTLNL